MAVSKATELGDVKYVPEAPSGRYVTLQAPDGRSTDVPAEIVDALRKSGYTDPVKSRAKK